MEGWLYWVIESSSQGFCNKQIGNVEPPSGDRVNQILNFGLIFYMLQSVKRDFVCVIPYLTAIIVLVQEACCGRWASLAVSCVCKCARLLSPSAWSNPKQQLSDFYVFELQLVSESTSNPPWRVIWRTSVFLNWTKGCVKDETLISWDVVTPISTSLVLGFYIPVFCLNLCFVPGSSAG